MNATARPVIIVLAGLAVILTATAISAIKHAQELNAQLAQTQTDLQKAQAAPAANPTAGSNDMLQKLLAEETAANAKLRKEIARLKNPPTAWATNALPVAAAGSTNVPAGSRWGGGNAWMERIQREDPERYKQIMADREQRRKEATDWYDNTQGQLAAQAQAAATPDEAEVATQIANTLSKLNDLRQQIQAARELPADQQQAQLAQLMPELQTAMQDMSQLREQDRTLQYQKLATQLGLTGDKAQTLVTAIPQIIQATQFTPPRGQGGFGFGGMPPATTPTTPIPPTTPK